MELKDAIRNIPDFPKEGIQFKDITPLLANKSMLHSAVRQMVAPYREKNIDVVLGMESRGFIFGAAAAIELGTGFAPVRKPGKLPYDTKKVTYDLEYGTDTLELHTDAFKSGDRVLVIDDLLATGGTCKATLDLIDQLGGITVGASFLIELTFLNGREKLPDTVDISSLIQYD